MNDYLNLSPTAERIVQIAEVLIKTRGYNGFSYEDIAQSVGIRKPSIHHHFATKPDLAAVVTQRYVQRFVDSLEGIDRSKMSPLERLLAYGQLFQDTYQDNRYLCLCGMLGAEQESLPESVRTHLKAFFELNLNWLCVTINQAWPKSARDAQSQALLLLSALEGSVIIGRSCSIADAPLKVARAFVAQQEA